MEGIRTFLDSSTIHGLRYISTTRKYVRLFWISIVITGFVAASLLIKESLDSWSQNPVKTTVETLPISEIRLPKVTVCPPRKSFTDLNYDLMMTENITLTEEMRDEMFKYAVEVINEDSLSENNWTKINEEDRYYNWYHGYTKIKSTFWSFKDHNLEYEIRTSAASGVVTTQYYGEQYQPELVERHLYVEVKIFPPESVKDNKNVTLHFKMEKVSMTGLSLSSKDWSKIEELGFLDYDQAFTFTNYTPSQKQDNYSISLKRHVNSDDVNVNQQMLEVMPGFRLSWWYTGSEVTSNPKYKDEEITRHFVR